MTQIKLTPAERDRIRLIRSGLAGWKRKGTDISAWEAVFFLKIIDRITKNEKARP